MGELFGALVGYYLARKSTDSRRQRQVYSPFTHFSSVNHRNFCLHDFNENLGVDWIKME
jgi:hypothetical protein